MKAASRSEGGSWEASKKAGSTKARYTYKNTIFINAGSRKAG